MQSSHSLHPVIEAYNDAWNRHDVDAILAMHTEDSVFCNHTSGGEAIGHDAIREIVTRVFETFPDIRFELRRLYVRDDLIVQEWTATATHCNPITFNNQILYPTNKIIKWNGMDILPMRHGKIIRKDVYTEMLSFLRQLGAAI